MAGQAVSTLSRDEKSPYSLKGNCLLSTSARPGQGERWTGRPNSPQLIERYRSQVIDIQNAEDIFQAVSAVFNRADIGDQISAVNAPTLVIAGKEDMMTSPAESEVIASRIPNARLAVIDEASHMVVVEKPQEVTQLICEFLKMKKVAGADPKR